MKARAVYEDGKWNGRTLREWVPDAVADIVRGFNPVRVILFGSVARGEEGPDSDLDFLVVLDHVDPKERARLMGKIRGAIDAPTAIDIFVTDPEEYERRNDVIGPCTTGLSAREPSFTSDSPDKSAANGFARSTRVLEEGT